MANLQQRADTILEAFKGQRNSRACYPCSKRKIRCEGDQPCITCSQRGHADICFYPDSKGARRGEARSKKRKAPSSNEQPSAAEKLPGAAPTDDAIPSNLRAEPPLADHGQWRHGNQTVRESPGAHSIGKTKLGKLSLASLVRDQLGAQNPRLSQDVRPGLGLENQAQNELLFRPFGALSWSDAFVELLPRRAEILQLFPHFRSFVCPFYPIVEDANALELGLLNLLDQYETLRDEKPGQLRSLLESSSAQLALFLSILALGAQFSHHSSSERVYQGQDLVQRAEAFLHLSNYIINPCLETVQTLLFIGLYMQNMGQSDGAWTLLGLTFRIAQALDLQNGSAHHDHSLWDAILWQDSLLSLRFDRLPMRPNGVNASFSPTLHHLQDTSYSQSMHCLNSLSLSVLSTPEQERVQQTNVTSQVERVDQILERSAPHLQNEKSCTTLQQRLECLALRMHASFLRAELCRPFLAQATVDGKSVTLRKRCLQSIQDTVQAYLNMAKISILPLRSWSLTHEALSCACVLALLKSSSADSIAPNILDKMLQLLEEVLRSDGDHTKIGMGRTFYRGVRLLKFLRVHISDVKEVAPSNQRRSALETGIGATTLDSLENALDGDMGRNNTSLLPTAPSIPMDVDLSQTLLEPLFTETALDNSLSSLLDLSSYFFK